MKIKRHIKKTLSAIIAVILALTFVFTTFTCAIAAGSAQLNVDNDGYRFYTEYFNRDSAGLTRKTIVKVYLMKGETAYFGSSVADSRMNLEGTNVVKDAKGNEIASGIDIVLTYPDGSKHAYDVHNEDGNTEGYIANYKQEENGPQIKDSDLADETKYVPLTYTADVEGIYTFEFHSQRGMYSGLAQNGATKVSDPQDQKNFTVAHWDVTVANSSKEVKTGRAWTTLLALSAGASKNIKANLEVYVLTNDGFIYKVNFKDIIPFGFTFFANNQGFTTTDKMPYSIYHSFYDNDNALNGIETEEYVTVHKPYMPDTELSQTFKIFFEKPNKDLIGKVYNEPGQVESIQDLTFHGQMTIMGTAHYGQGGYFTFTSKGATSTTISIDFRDSIEEMVKNGELAPGAFKGSGVVELSGAVTDGENTFYWDGKDTSGAAIPAGVYGKNKIHTASESKSGEVHFPFIDVEGLCGGVQIERITNGDDGHGKYDIYYNNNPLVYNTIEYDDINNTRYTPSVSGRYATLSDGTRSMADGIASSSITSGNGLYGGKYFEKLTQDNDKPIEYTNISTLHRDTPQYIYEKEHGNHTWSALTQEERDAYTAECADFKPTFHHEPNDSSKDTIVFDSPADSNANGGGNQAGIDIWTYYSDGVTNTELKTDMQILHADNVGKITGRVFYDENSNKGFDISGTDYPLKNMKVELVDRNGNPITKIENRPLFDKDGYFLRDEQGNIIYEEQEITYTTYTNKYGVYTFTGVPIIDGVETEYFVHVCLTPIQVLTQGYKLTTTSNNTILKSGGDGNRRLSTGECAFDDNDNPVYLRSNSQSVKISSSNTEAEFLDIGYHTLFTVSNTMNYQVTKEWPNDGTKSLDNITVKLFVYTGKESDNIYHDGHGINSRKGVLVDTVKLSATNNWSYTWPHLDKNLQYFVIEYYTKTDSAGNIMYNDAGDERLVLIGGTMPIYSEAPKAGENEYYDFKLDEESTERLKEYYGDGVVHQDATNDFERVTNIDTNVLQYNVTYTTTRNKVEELYSINLRNDQTYDEREYYVWLNHESELPDFVTTTLGTGVDANGEKIRESKELKRDENGNILGLVVTSLDAPVNTYGDATKIFLHDANNPTSVKYTATTHGDYPEGTGTRTYKVEYTDPDDPDKNTFSWTLTIHVYTLGEDTYVFDYGLKAKLQEAEAQPDMQDYEYMLFSDDVTRVERYKYALDETMHTCSDLVGIAYSPNGVVSDAEAKALDWQDTLSKDETKNGTAKVQGKNGLLEANLTVKRTTHIPEGDDHFNYAEVTFTPTTFMSVVDVFYYKVIVFAEDYRYQYSNYDQIDATSGVIMYIPVRIMPASIVYYEDGYRFSTEYSKNNFEITNDPFTTVTADTGYQSINQKDLYGYDAVYTDPFEATAGQFDSLGSTTDVNARASKFSFPFTGTGFDLIGRTDSTAAKITYRIDRVLPDGTKKLYPAGGTVDASYVNQSDQSLHQIPVVSVKDLPYDNYYVTASLITSSTGSYHFNLDGIRIYDPLGVEGSEFYIENEKNADTTTIRDMILGSITEEQLGQGYEPSDATAAIIYSGSLNGTYLYGSTVTEIRSSSHLVNHSEDLKDYLSAGPKEELYIPSGSGIAFMAKPDSTPDDNTMQLEMKAVYGGDLEIPETHLGYGKIDNVGEDQEINLESSTPMYYNINTDKLAENNNLVILVNTSDWTISVSNLKTKGYTLSFPKDFVITSEQVGLQSSFSEPNEVWTEEYTDIAENVTVLNANFATSYARAGKEIYLNETIVEPYSPDNETKSAYYMPLVIDEKGNTIELSERDFTPMRSYKTTYTATAEDGTEQNLTAYAFVYKIKLIAPTDAAYMGYTVGAISRQLTNDTEEEIKDEVITNPEESIDTTETVETETTPKTPTYSENAWNVFVTVKSSEIQADVKVYSLYPGVARAVITSDEAIKTSSAGWTQQSENVIYTDFVENGSYAVVLLDVDGYEDTVQFSVDAVSDDGEIPINTETVNKLSNLIKNFIKKILTKFFKIEF